MSISVLGIEFDHHDYDDRGDTLFLHVGPPREPARTVETPEGHIVEYGADGALIGLELLNVRWTLERQGKLVLTWPQAEVDAAALTSALAAA